MIDTTITGFIAKKINDTTKDIIDNELPKYSKHFDTFEIYKELDNIYMNSSLNVDYKVKKFLMYV